MQSLDLKITDKERHLQAPKETTQRFSQQDKTKLQKASKDFESMLTSMMLKSMMKTEEGSMFGTEGYGGDMLDTVFQNEIAKYMTDSKGLGVAGMLYKKLTGEDLKTEKIQTGAKQNSLMPDVKLDKAAPEVSPSKSAMERLDKFEPIINEASENYGVDKNLIKSVILTESAAKQGAVSSVRAKGLMQLMDSTASSMGVKNSFDPKENINGGTKYLSGLLRKYDGDLKLALAAYNAGPGAVNKYGGVPPYTETKNYIARVIGYYNHLEG